MPIYGLRMCSGYKGGSNFYHHADVIARNKEAALKAAKEGRVRHWRWIDTFDTAPRTYKNYEYLGVLSSEQANDPERPLPIRLKRLEDKIEKLDGVRGATIRSDVPVAHIALSVESRTLKVQIKNILRSKVEEVNFHYSPATA